MESCLLGLLCLHGLTWNEQLKKYCNFCQSKKLDSHLSKKLVYLLQWKTFKNDEKCFLFYVKSSFVLKIFI